MQDNAIVVDMSSGFTDVTPTAADPTIFRVGAGVRLGPLYYALWQQGKRAIPGGTCPTVGAGGHILGAECPTYFLAARGRAFQAPLLG